MSDQLLKDIQEYEKAVRKLSDQKVKLNEDDLKNLNSKESMCLAAILFHFRIHVDFIEKHLSQNKIPLDEKNITELMKGCLFSDVKDQSGVTEH